MITLKIEENINSLTQSVQYFLDDCVEDDVCCQVWDSVRVHVEVSVGDCVLVGAELCKE